MMAWMKKICIMTMALSIFLLANITASAEGEWSFFGSESYEWSLDVESPIGIYVQSGDPMETVDMLVHYDPAVLQYNSGGDLEEEGTVRVKASAGQKEQFSTMLYFTPLALGKTEVEIDEVTVTYSSGEEASAFGASVPVTVAIPEECMLKSLLVNGEPLEGFDPEKTRYSIEVESGLEKVEIEAEANSKDVKVSVSDTTLQDGENTITITSSNEEEKKMVYTLQVKRPQAQPVVNQQPTEKPMATPSPVPQSGLLGQDILRFVLPAVLILIAIAALVVAFVFIRAGKKSKQEKKNLKHAKSIPAVSSDSGKRTSARAVPKKKKNKGQHSVSSEIPEVSKNTEALSTFSPYDLDTCENLDELEQFTLFDNRENAIEVRNVTMCFKRQKNEASSIKEMVIQIFKRQRKVEKFRALKDVSFIVKKGDVVGIIGTNGSGKSTLLKIISGVLQPTSGTVKVDRKKIQLLTLGTGFDYELTGKENVYLNGAIIGYTKAYIDEKYEEIVKFAELEGFMDEKVRNYSSGMVSRLGFAIATIRDTPEILILDEVLSVGDMFFRKKSTARIKEMMQGGSTVLIVSHSPSVIRDNCNKAIWIEKGVLRAAGEPAEVCRMYENQKK